jgi:hypothetical protein
MAQRCDRCAFEAATALELDEHLQTEHTSPRGARLAAERRGLAVARAKASAPGESRALAEVRRLSMNGHERGVERRGPVTAGESGGKP